MPTPKDKFNFDGEILEENVNVVNQNDVVAGDGIEVTKSGKTVTFATEVPFSVVDGKVCVTFQKEESNG